MVHLPNLIIDLGLILGVAAVVTLLFKWLKQPLVLGYIIAGILVSPNFSFFPTVIDTENVNVWAEIGIIFLLFSLGLEFSFKKLQEVGGSATVAGIIEAIGMTAVGYLAGQLLGWSQMDSIFLGSALAVSSTTIVIKAVEELGLKKKKFATLVFGILIVEDLITIARLVLLTTLAVSQEFNGGEMVFSVLKLGFFLVLWFVTGIFFIPSILKMARRLMNEESLLIVSIAMCLLMVFLAYKAGFSPALGAFIMGSLLSETSFSEKIEHLVKPVKDLFGAIFFVSVGMLINFEVIDDHVGAIALITLVCITGKILNIGLGAFLSGNSLKVSLQTGMSLAQIGEFSFIIAALGLSLKATSEFLYPILITVSAITTFTTPYLMRASGPLYNWIDGHLPDKWRRSLSRYSAEATHITAVSDWHQVLKSFLVNIVIFSVLTGAVIYLASGYAVPWLEENAENPMGWVVVAVASLAVMAPFIWGLTVRNEQNEAFARIYAQQRYRGPIWLMRGIKISLALFFIVYLLVRVSSFNIAVYAAIALLILFIVFRKKIQGRYDKLEHRFIQNLNDKQLQEELLQMEMKASRRNADMAPWDAHMTTFEVQPELPFLGQTLEELQWRERIGVNIAMIKRGKLTLLSPDKNEYIFPCDKLYIICTDAQERKMNAILRPPKNIPEEAGETLVDLEKFTLDNDSVFLHKNLRNSGIRAATNGIVVGVERNGQRILNPESTLVFQEGDVVWIVGEKKRLQEMFKQEKEKADTNKT